MDLIVLPCGTVRANYSEDIELASLGPPTIVRDSYVEPDREGRWLADLAPVSGPVLGPFSRRSDALQAELAWLEANWLIKAC
jgi:hypothetical protein